MTLKQNLTEKEMVENLSHWYTSKAINKIMKRMDPSQHAFVTEILRDLFVNGMQVGVEIQPETIKNIIWES